MVVPRAAAPYLHAMRILAVDFETADNGRDSACAIGAALVVDGRIVERVRRLIRPPRPLVMFTQIHGIRWTDVVNEPHFGGIWSDVADLFEAADLYAAHNAAFDRGVLRGCCQAYGIAAPERPWICTVKLSRAAWNLRPTKLPNVCDHFGIELDHHDALSDAAACAEITCRAIQGGHALSLGLLGEGRRVY